MTLDIKMDTWELIKENKFELACSAADKEFEKDGSLFPLRNKVFALLNLKKYSEVIELTKKIILINEGSTDSDFFKCGLGYWFQGKYEQAIDVWDKARNTKYTDAAGGVEIHLLFLYAAIRIGSNKIEKKALRDLKQKCKNKSSSCWPDSIGHYILGNIDENEVLESISSVEPLKQRQLCQFGFYKGVLMLKSGNINLFLDEMQKCVDYGRSAYLEEEYYLAKHEIELVSNNRKYVDKPHIP